MAVKYRYDAGHLDNQVDIALKEHAMAERSIVRILWHFCEGIVVPVLPVRKRLFRPPIDYRLYDVVGELFRQDGTLWFNIRRSDGIYSFHNQSFWLELFHHECEGRKIFRALWEEGLHFEHRNWLRFDFEAINGENFTDTALDRAVIVFDRLDIQQVIPIPIIGKIFQCGSVGMWHDRALYQFGEAAHKHGPLFFK